MSESERIMTRQKKAGFFGLGFAAVLLAGVAMVQGEDDDKDLPPPPEDMIFEWTAPTTGTIPVKYEVQIRTGGVNSDDIRTDMVDTNRITFAVEWLTVYEVRVRGIDAQNRVGPWSIWSLAEDRDMVDPDDDFSKK